MGWETFPDAFCNQSELLRDYLAPFESEIIKLESTLERNVCGWCIQNYVPLKQFERSKDIYICFYENFCVDVVKETKYLFKWLEQDDSSISENRLQKPSKMSKQHSAVLSGGDLVKNWMNFISKAEIERGNEILEIFGMHEIYDAEGFPKMDISSFS